MSNECDNKISYGMAKNNPTYKGLWHAMSSEKYLHRIKFWGKVNENKRGQVVEHTVSPQKSRFHDQETGWLFISQDDEPMTKVSVRQNQFDTNPLLSLGYLLS